MGGLLGVIETSLHYCWLLFFSSLQSQWFLLGWVTFNLQLFINRWKKKRKEFFKSRIRQVNVKYSRADLKSHSELPFISIKIRSRSSTNSSLIHSFPKASASRSLLHFQERKKRCWFPHGLSKTILAHTKCCCLTLCVFSNTSSFWFGSTVEAVRVFWYRTWPFLLPIKKNNAEI